LPSANSGRSPIPPSDLQGFCRSSCKTLQILSGDFRRFASPFNSLGIFHGRLMNETWRKRVRSCGHLPCRPSRGGQVGRVPSRSELPAGGSDLVSSSARETAASCHR
jgi:hypothetical protein